MQPLKITIELSTPMQEPGQLFHLDGLLGAMRVAQAKKIHGESINPRDYHYDIPVDKEIFPSGEWVFKASAFQIKRETPTFMWMQTGRINLAEAARHRAEGWLKLRAAKPVLGGGPFKTSLYHTALVWADLVAYCIGDKEKVEALLEGCEYIGGRRGVGSGQVKNITVEVLPEEKCCWEYRAMPKEWADPENRYALVMSALSAPYWDKTRHKLTKVPLEL